MRVVRFAIVILILPAIFVLAIGESRLARQPFAQITAAPGPAPLTAPVAPGQPQSFSTIGALPALAPAPGTQLVGVPTTQATPRAFRCTCSGPGAWTQWAGVVASSNYILARQAARGQCTIYQVNQGAKSPYLTPESGGIGTLRPSLQNGSAFTSRAQQATSLTQITQGQLNQTLLEQSHGECSNCACN